MLSIRCELEAEQEAVEQRSARRADKHVSLVVCAQSSSLSETNTSRSQLIFPTKRRIVILRRRQHVHLRQRARGSVCDKRRRPANLLQVSGAVGRLDRLEFGHATEWSHH